MEKYIFYIWLGAAQLMWTICHTRRFGFPKSQFCASEVVRIPLFCLTFSFNLVACVLVVFWLFFGCVLVLFWLCFGCVLVVFGLHHYCIQLCFLYLVETLLCIFPSPLRLFSPAHLLAFILIAFQLYLSVHTHIWWKHFFANSPCFVSAARPACPPPPLLTSTSSPQTWRASETRVEILTDFKSQMQPMDIIAKW